MVDYLPSQTETSQGLFFLVGGFGKQMTIDHRVQQPVPILLRHIRDEPRVSLTMESNLIDEPTLNEEVR